MTHLLKTELKPFQAVNRGTKHFEVRRDDRKPKFKVGDTLKLAQLGRDGVITGKWVAARVRWLTRDPRWVKKGFCIMSIEVMWRNT